MNSTTNVSGTTPPDVVPPPTSAAPDVERDGIWVALILVAVYLPVCFGRYAFYDDYYWLWASAHEWHRWPEFLTKFWSDGRPFVFISLLLMKFAGDVGSMWFARVPCLIGTSLLGWRLWRAARNAGWSRTTSFVLSLSIGCSPALQVSANWVLCATFTYACLATEWAVAAIWQNQDKRPVALTRWTTATLACLFAFLCFQPAGCFIWVWAVIRVAPRTGAMTASARHLARVLGVFVIAAGLAYLVLRTAPTPTARAELVTDIPRKIYWFVRNPLLDSLALTSAMYRWVGWSITALLLLLSTLGFAKLRRLPPSLVLVAACIPLSFFANLVIAEGWISYRTQMALAPVVAVLLWGTFAATFAVTSPRTAQIVSSVAATMLTAIAAGQMVWGYTIPQTREWQHLNAELSRAGDLPSKHRLEIRLAAHDDAVGSAARYDEFGVPSSLSAWAFGPMLLLALHERGIPAPERIVILESTQPPPAHGIDMRALQSARRP